MFPFSIKRQMIKMLTAVNQEDNIELSIFVMEKLNEII